MKRRKFTYYQLVIALLTVFYGCTEEIDLKLNDSFPRLVVEGHISTDTVYQKVILSKTAAYLGDVKVPAVSGANIKVSDGQHEYLFVPSGFQQGVYYSQLRFAGIPGKTYRISISNVDIDGDGKSETYHAEDKMKNFFYVDSLQSVKEERNGQTFFHIYGFAQEPPTPGDFYMFRYYVNGTLISDSLDEYRLYNDEFVNGNYLSHIPMGTVRAKVGDTLTIESNSISEGFFNFFLSFLFETVYSGNAFSGPPANIESNLDNGALGYFGTEARTRFYYILK